MNERIGIGRGEEKGNGNRTEEMRKGLEWKEDRWERIEKMGFFNRWEGLEEEKME